MPKTRKPVADYITFDQYKKMVKDEPDPMWKLLYRYMWTFMLRVSEVVGQDTHDVKAIKQYRKERKAFVEAINGDPKRLKAYLQEGHVKPPKLKESKWVGALPGIRPIDIGVDPPTLRVYRKHGKFDILPFPKSDPTLWKDTVHFIQERGIKMDMDSRLFPRSRRAVLTKMQLYGQTVGGQTLIHPHALRRGGGIHYRDKGGKIEVLQVVYNHERMSQTFDYIGRDKKAALAEFAKA